MRFSAEFKEQLVRLTEIAEGAEIEADNAVWTAAGRVDEENQERLVAHARFHAAKTKLALSGALVMVLTMVCFLVDDE
jgi:hypothetical protein